MNHPEHTGIQTFSGKMFDFAHPHPDNVNIIDIAQGLSMLCRYAGQSRFFYSVGEHSLWVSHAVPKELAFVGLMHDATEAYMCDIPRPLKRMLPGYMEIEDRVWRIIAAKFGLPAEIPQEVKEVDTRMLVTERPVLFDPPLEWPSTDGLKPIDRRIVCAPPHVVFNSFMKRFHDLTEGKFTVAVGDDTPRIIVPTVH